MAQNQVLAGVQERLSTRLQDDLASDAEYRKMRAKDLHDIIWDPDATDDMKERAHTDLIKLYPQHKDLLGRVKQVSSKVAPLFKKPPSMGAASAAGTVAQDVGKAQSSAALQDVTSRDVQAGVDPNVAATYTGMLAPPPTQPVPPQAAQQPVAQPVEPPRQSPQPQVEISHGQASPVKSVGPAPTSGGVWIDQYGRHRYPMDEKFDVPLPGERVPYPGGNNPNAQPNPYGQAPGQSGGPASPLPPPPGMAIPGTKDKVHVGSIASDIGQILRTKMTRTHQEELDKEQRKAATEQQQELLKQSGQLNLKQLEGTQSMAEKKLGEESITERANAASQFWDAEPTAGIMFNKHTGETKEMPASTTARLTNMQHVAGKLNGADAFAWGDPKTGHFYKPGADGNLVDVSSNFKPAPNASIQIVQASQPSANMPADLREGTQRAMMGITSPIERLGTATAINQLTAAGDSPNAVATIKQVALDNDRSDAAKAVTGRRETMQALTDIDQLLSQVPQNLVVGSIEDIARKLGLTTDPRYVEIGNQLLPALQAYRKAVTGAQFGMQETGEYSKIFPSYSNTAPVNKAQIKGFMDALKRNDKIYWENRLGKGRDWSDFGQMQQGKVGGQGTLAPPPGAASPKTLDVNTAKQFLQQAGGDKAKAKAAAAAAGYEVK